MKDNLAVINNMAFTPEEVKKGMHLDLINYLMLFNEKSYDSSIDMHIYTDGYCTCIDWIVKINDVTFDGFEYVDEDHEVLKRVEFPDKHLEYLYDDEEKEAIDDFLKGHPEYYRNEYGRWVNKKEELYLANSELLDDKL